MTTPLARLTAALADRYRLDRELGQGGMATVYLAEDLKHGRNVAIKVLHPELSAVIGGERFLTEIKTTAGLQHPHILGLIDSGAADGLLYYVMPFIEGETLRARLTREKQLPVEDAVRLTKEVAAALEFAHKRGIVHRDIKPENILLQDGAALVADFGIALAVQQAGGSRMTQTGMSLGTPAYMSPEQAMGERDIGPRSDVYALGAMTYEMLAGEPPFTGPNSQAIVAKVLTEAPPLLRPKRPTVSPAIEAAVLTALQKLPADRFGSAKDFADALDGGGKGAGYAQTVVTGATRATLQARPARLGRLAAAALIATAAGTAGWFLRDARRAPEFPPVVSRYVVALPDSTAYQDAAVGASLARAPDGSAFAYSSRAGLMLRYADSVDAVPVPGGRRGAEPFFSPDGRWLGFQEGGRLVKVPLAGGTSVAICDSCVGYTFSWGGDDTVRYHTRPSDNASMRVLMAVSARGGTPREFARPDSGSGEAFRQPILLPGRRTVLFALYTGKSSRLAALDLRTGAITRFDQAGFSPQWVDRGFVVLGSTDGTLIALPFDAARVRPTGAPVTIVRDVVTPDGASRAQAAIAATGSIVYAQAGAASVGQLALVSRSGQATSLVAEQKAYANPRFSPDGSRLAVQIAAADGAGRDVWILDVTQQAWSRLTTNGISDRPAWLPDGRRIVYSSNVDLWWMAADGSGRPDSLLVANGSRFAGSITPDGHAVVFQESGSEHVGIRALAFDSAPAARMVIPGPSNESAPALSPDGRWLAYQSDQSGRMEVYVRPYPGPGAQVPVSLQGGTEPAWSRNGRELFYRAGDVLMAASVTSSPGFAVAERRALFSGSFLSGGRFREYDVAPDAQHFVMVRGAAARSTLIALDNVFERLVYDRQGKR